MNTRTYPLGIDFGGSGIKGAPVDLDKGEFAAERLRRDTPTDSIPERVVDVVADIVAAFGRQAGENPVGITVPGVVMHGVVKTAANIDRSWIDADAENLLSTRLGRPVTMLNDADAAGIAEMRFGAGMQKKGVVLVSTLGTGIGSALFVDGILVPNTELGHLEIDGHDAETRASSGAREKADLSWEKWAKRLQRYYSHVESLVWPDLIIVGGGVSKKADRFLPLLDLRVPIVAAQLRNDAGIIGAAYRAVEEAS